MTPLAEQIKTSLRIRNNALDDEIEFNVGTCLCDLIRVGISATYAIETTENALIKKACELYCKSEFNFNGDGERFKVAYEGFRDALSLDGDLNAINE